MRKDQDTLEYKKSFNCINSSMIFYRVEDRYRKKDYKNALAFLENSLQKIDIESAALLSRYYDLAASLLWKLGEKEGAHSLWLKSCDYDNTNRHSALSLALLFEENPLLSNICELFVKLKLNEYYSLKDEYEENKCCLDCFEEDRVLKYLLNFWEDNLASKNLETMDELELVEFFINLEVF